MSVRSFALMPRVSAIFTAIEETRVECVAVKGDLMSMTSAKASQTESMRASSAYMKTPMGSDSITVSRKLSAVEGLPERVFLFHLQPGLDDFRVEPGAAAFAQDVEGVVRAVECDENFERLADVNDAGE